MSVPLPRSLGGAASFSTHASETGAAEDDVWDARDSSVSPGPDSAADTTATGSPSNSPPPAASDPSSPSSSAPPSAPATPRRRNSSNSSASSAAGAYLSGGKEGWGQSAPNAAASSTTKFALTKSFLAKWRNKTPPFGYNGLGELVYRRTYSRKRAEGGGEGSGESANETWSETVERVVNGTYNMQKRWIESHELGWNAWKAQASAQEMYERMWNMKFLPPGRGLWAMGSPITEQRGLYAALNNCAYVTTEGLEKEDDKSKPFTFLMDASMLGVGVGFDTKGAGKVLVKGVHPSHPPRTYVIPDSREGWVEALRLLLNAHISGKEGPISFDYSLIRPFGTPIKGFGGVASGPAALKELLDCVRQLLESRAGQTLSLTDITDIMNLIGRCVVAGNVRRTAEIAFGAPDSDEYLDLKNYEKNPQRAEFGWTSNNSVFATPGMDYSKVCDRVRRNGEPGFAWLDNMQNYARMNGTVDSRDHRVRGGNPCLEQSLESYELCCLVETFPSRHADEADFQRTLKFAYLYAKTVTLGKTQWPETNRVMLRNRRIGCSVSGIAQFISQHGLHTLQGWLERGYSAIQRYDKDYSDWFAIPRSIKTTSVKPSGTVSLLAGATPGMHYPESRFYIRRMRLSAASELVAPLAKAGYPLEPVKDGGANSNTLVVEIPVDVGEGVRTANQVPMWEQLALAAFLQRHWADNQVSCTVTFDPVTEGPQLEQALDFYQYQLKGISFLPKLALGAYPQMPYEAIDEAEYKRRLAELKPLHFADARVRTEEANPERFCDGDICSVDGGPTAGTGEAVSVDQVSVDPTIDARPQPQTQTHTKA